MMAEHSHEPIYSRYERILEDKRRKQEAIEDQKKQREEQEYEAYMAEFQSHHKVPDSKRTPEEFYEGMKLWKERKQHEAQEIAQRNKNKELDGITFQPTINKNSERLLGNKKRVPIY